MRKELVCIACGHKILSLKTAYLDPKTGNFYHRECGIAAMKMSKNPAKTVAQQKLFAIALGIKKGQIARSYSAEAAKMADRMSVRKLEEFARTRFNPLQQNILPELATLALTGFGIGIGYKTAGAAWDKVAGKKNPQVDDKPDPKGQTCPKCGKTYHDFKWGGTGKCSCGYYFHPEWYNKSRNPYGYSCPICKVDHRMKSSIGKAHYQEYMKYREEQDKLADERRALEPKLSKEEVDSKLYKTIFWHYRLG